MELVVNEYQLPVVKMNYEQLEAELKNRLTEYKGLAVTDDTLPACKDAQKELAAIAEQSGEKASYRLQYACKMDGVRIAEE